MSHSKKFFRYTIFILLIAFYIIVYVLYHQPIINQKSLSVCSLDGEQIDVLIDIQWRKYYLKGTELYGKIQFGENEFLSRRNKFPPIALGKNSFFERLSDKKNRYRDILLFYSADPVEEYISLNTIFILTSDINTFDVILLNYYNYLTEEYEIFYGPAVTKEEAEVIASEYFGFNVNY